MKDDWAGIEEMRKLGKIPAQKSQFADGTSQTPPAVNVIQSTANISYGSYARSVIKGRRRITAYFSQDLFGDPVFDMLLFLFSSSEEKRPASVTACCEASGVPTTTALRWLKIMEQRGMITRQPDSKDARKVNLLLTPSAEQSMRSWLTEISSIPLSREL